MIAAQDPTPGERRVSLVGRLTEAGGIGPAFSHFLDSRYGCQADALEAKGYRTVSDCPILGDVMWHYSHCHSSP